MAVALLAPEEPITERYSRWSTRRYWFMTLSIADTRPLSAGRSQDNGSLEVAFFPAYPAIAALLRNAFNISTAHGAFDRRSASPALGFDLFLPVSAGAGKLRVRFRGCGTLSHPGEPRQRSSSSPRTRIALSYGRCSAFHLLEHRGVRTLRVLRTIAWDGLMSATRNCREIVCAAFHLVRSGLRTGWPVCSSHANGFSREPRSCRFDVWAACGGSVFSFWQLRWGHWTFTCSRRRLAGALCPITLQCLDLRVIAGLFRTK